MTGSCPQLLADISHFGGAAKSLKVQVGNFYICSCRNILTYSILPTSIYYVVETGRDGPFKVYDRIGKGGSRSYSEAAVHPFTPFSGSQEPCSLRTKMIWPM